MHHNTDSFVCDYCNRTFTRKYNLQTHIENCHLNLTCYCDICEQRFGRPAGLLLHLSRGHNTYGQPFPECDICGRVFTRKQNIISHMSTVHFQGIGPEICCRFCSKTFTAERNLRRHVNQLHNPDIECPTCNECNRTFKGKDTLIAHLQSAHTKVLYDFQCNMCDKLYSNNRSLKRHIERFHTQRLEFKCDLCPKVYTSNQSLKRHLKNLHNFDISNQYVCEYCSDIINNTDSHTCRSLLNSHDYNKQVNECFSNNLISAEFVCESCSKEFVEEPNLRQHIKAEHSFKIFYEYCRNSLLKQLKYKKNDRYWKQNLSYNCEYCSSAYLNVYELKLHMKIDHDVEYCLSTCNVCFNKFYSQEKSAEHKQKCLPPKNVNSCHHCDKLFTDISSLEFHTKTFHPQAHIADPDVTSTIPENFYDLGSYQCVHCDRAYYSDRSLKHHVKLKHTTDEVVECKLCGKICNNKYYLASHIKIVHNNDAWSKCDYCDKLFKSKRNIRRHIEYTHLGMQRYKCIECETLFKEKRSLRKHVRTKHPNSAAFPQCHICYKRFESAKSCKIHLKLLHSFNMNTHPCGLCSVSFSSNEALSIHLQTKHLAEDEIYKCEECNLVFKGHEKFEQHNEISHISLVSQIKHKVLPRCIICIKDFSTRKTLKRHIKKFHQEFDLDDLANFAFHRRTSVECEDCIKSFSEESYFNVYQKLKHSRDSVIFKCLSCSTSFNTLEYAIQRYKLMYLESEKSKMILSELCTTEMSDGEASTFGSFFREVMEPESTTIDIKIEPEDIILETLIKSEPVSP